jgi:hypothetical protein
MNAPVFYLLSMLLIAVNVSAQPIRGVNALFKVGYGYSPSLQKVEQDLPSGERITFSKHLMLVGCEANFRLERAIIGIKATAAVPPEHPSVKYSEPLMLSGHFRFGYILAESSRTSLYPSVGTGPAFILFSSYTSENGEYHRAKQYQLLSPSVDFGLNTDFVFPRLSTDVKNYDRFTVGIRLGYIYSFTENHWRDSDWNRVPEMNVYRNKSFYVTVVAGMAGFSRGTQQKK